MASRNLEMRKLLSDRLAELKQTHTVGDGTHKRVLAAEFKDRMGSSTDDAAYQMVCYYLRDIQAAADARVRHSVSTLRQLILMTSAEREQYAKDVGQSIKGLNQAIARFSSRMTQGAYTEAAESAAKQRIEMNDYFDWTSKAELTVMQFDVVDIKRVQTLLKNPYGLSLRSPNILYHAHTSRCYHMTISEQVALIANPVKFLKLRQDRIKANWVVKDLMKPEVDPTATPQSAVMSKTRPGTPVVTGGKYIFTGESKRENSQVMLYKIRRRADGRLGGWISDDACLSHDGTCWVDDGAVVFNAVVKDNACVRKFARVSGGATIAGDASITDRAIVRGEGVVVDGSATVRRNGFVGDNAHITDRADVAGSSAVTGDAVVKDNAAIFGEARIYGNAIISGNARVSGTAVFNGDDKIRRGRHNGKKIIVK